MKKLKKLGIVSLICVLGGIGHAQWIDPSNMGFNVLKMAEMAKQLEELKRQYDQMKETYEETKKIVETGKEALDAIKGIRNLGDVLNSPLLQLQLPEGWDDITSTSGDSAAKAVLEKSGVFASCDGDKKCEDASLFDAKIFSQNEKMLKNANERMDNINKFMGEINKTEDPKAIAELSARIQTEQALLQNDTMRMDMLEKMTNSTEKLRQKKEINDWSTGLHQDAH